MMRSKGPIIPAALVTSEKSFAEHLDFAKRTSNSIHIDVIDGEFCRGSALDTDKWPMVDVGYSEAHLMVKKPLDYFEQLKQKNLTRALIHIESEFDKDELVERARSLDLLLGFVINPETDLEALRPYYSLTSYFQVMGVHPGRIGQEMLETTNLAISYIRRTSPNHRLVISVDGGVTKENIPALKRSGADYFVSSAAIYEGEKSWEENYTGLMEAAQ
jgi:pentose-5-phosphate-3-epimerase